MSGTGVTGGGTPGTATSAARDGVDRRPLAAIVGEAAVREAAGSDVVQGVSPRLIVEAGDEAEVAAVLQEAARQHLGVVTRGGGTKLDWGTPPTRCDIVLSTRRLDHLIEHQPGDLVCVAQAGMSLGALQGALSGTPEHRQRLMLDPPHGLSATLGGIVATAASGPLRSRYGTPRDLLIGVRFVLSDGTIGHAGGKVVKNVAGYDVGKVLTGSLGTLAVLTQVAFKLHPLPVASRTVILEDASAQSIAAFVSALRTLPVVPSSVDVVWPEGLVVVRVESSESGAERQITTVVDRAGGRRLGDAEALAQAERLAPRPWGGPGVIAGVAVPRTRMAELLEVSTDYCEELIVRALPAVGEARLAPDPEVISGLRVAVERLGGHLVLHRAPGDLGDLVWPRADPVQLDLMRSLKHALDPGSVLSPGRALGGT